MSKFSLLAQENLTAPKIVEIKGLSDEEINDLVTRKQKKAEASLERESTQIWSPPWSEVRTARYSYLRFRIGVREWA